MTFDLAQLMLILVGVSKHNDMMLPLLTFMINLTDFLHSIPFTNEILCTYFTEHARIITLMGSCLSFQNTAKNKN